MSGYGGFKSFISCIKTNSKWVKGEIPLVISLERHNNLSSAMKRETIDKTN